MLQTCWMTEDSSRETGTDAMMFSLHRLYHPVEVL
jgi:hypothetical protein